MLKKPDRTADSVWRGSRGSKQDANKKKFKKITFSLKGLSAVCILANAAPSRAEVLDIKTFSDLAQRCGSTVAALTLAAIAKTESRFQTLVVADNTTHVSRTYQNLDQAVLVGTRLITRGDSVDLGLMQINSANLKRLGMTVREALDPCKAIRAAASIMTSNFLASKRARTQQIALRNAISMYNTGNATYGYKNGYVRRVEVAARSLAMYFDAYASTRLAMNGTPSGLIQVTRNIEPWDVWGNTAKPLNAAASREASSDVYIF